MGKQSVTVRTSGGLSDADIERMVQEAEQMRESDEKRKEAVQLKNDGETLCYQVEKQLSDLKDKISSDDATDLKTKVEELRSSMAAEGTDPQELKDKTKELQEASWKVTQQVYQQNTDNEESNDGKDDAKK